MASISVRDLHIRFAIFDHEHVSLKRRLLSFGRGPKRVPPVVHALRGISFEVADGDRIGLIGHNGSGKSTLLRTLANVYPPRSGELIIDGSQTSLFDVSAGMDIDATGHENILLLGVSCGMTRKQVQTLREEIVAFADLGDAMSRPVRTYSAGMQLRLAFGVATAKPAEILLIDEVIGVGDANFMERATARMDDLMGQARILVMASHSDDVLRQNCNRGIVLSHGTIAFDGPIDEAIAFAHPKVQPPAISGPRHVPMHRRRRGTTGRSASLFSR